MNEPSSPDIALLNAALELPASQRSAYLDQACSGQPELRRRVGKLMEALERAGSFMERTRSPHGESTATAQIAPPPEPQPGDRIGRYKLLEKVGEGGCGIVYVAEQEEPVRRRIALKLIKPGMDSKQVIARFEAERQALAMMDHPNIARVFDAGTTEQGRPYFVMELVRGVRITEYCDQVKLPTTERLKLFTQVCHAIQHAHQKGIIHRDIKPSNILVTLHDGVAVPKVIDFGIAKATEGRLTDATVYTQLHQFMGTPAYVSPEQAEMSGLDIDTRSDIYSLGVLLYELLTGSTPFDASALLKSGLDALRRAIREEEPARPSRRLSTMAGDLLTTTARQRQTEAPRLIHQVRGDLDWIVMKCLEKDRRARYETVNGLAADIDRHLNNEPVTAVAPTFGYQLEKFYRRNKVQVRVVAAFMGILIMATVVSSWQAFRATQAERRAEERSEAAQKAERCAQSEANKSEQTARFLQDMLAGVSPSVAEGRDTSLLRDILEKTEQRIQKELNDQPAVKASLLRTLTRTYREMELYDKTESLGREALRLTIATDGEDHVNTLNTLKHLAHALREHDKEAEAEELDRRMINTAKRMFGPESKALAEYLAYHARTLQLLGRLSEAEDNFKVSIALSRKLEAYSTLSMVLMNYAGFLLKRGDVSAADSALREIMNDEQLRQHFSKPQSLAALGHMAILARKRGDLDSATKLHRQVVELGVPILGEDHPVIEIALRNLGELAYDQSEFASATNWFHRSVAVNKALKGASHQYVAIDLEKLARATAQCDPSKASKDAEPFYQQAQSIWQKWPGAETNSQYGLFLWSYALYLHKVDREEEAESLARASLQVRTNRIHATDIEICSSESLLGVIRATRGDKAEAEQHWERCLALLHSGAAAWTNAAKKAETHAIEVAGFFQRRKRFDEFVELYSLAHASRTRRLPANHESLITTAATLGSVLSNLAWEQRSTNGALALRRARDAERFLTQALTIVEGSTNKGRGRLGDMQSRLGDARAAVAVLDETLTSEKRETQLKAAEALMLDGQQRMRQSTSLGPEYRLAGAQRLVRLYQAWTSLGGNPDSARQAALWKQEVESLEKELERAAGKSVQRAAQ